MTTPVTNGGEVLLGSGKRYAVVRSQRSCWSFSGHIGRLGLIALAITETKMDIIDATAHDTINPIADGPINAQGGKARAIRALDLRALLQ
jgi:hypothetical protein